MSLSWVFVVFYSISVATAKNSENDWPDGISADKYDCQIVKQLLESVNELKAQNIKQQAFMEQMKKELLKQNAEMDKMKETLKGYEIKIKEVSTGKGRFKSKVKISPEWVQSITEISNATSRTPEQSFTAPTQSRNNRQIVNPTVAFSAIATDSVSHYGAANENIKFEKADVNSGNAYDPTSGVFTAPSAGIYVISASILSVANKETSCDIIVNGNARARLYARGTDDRHDQGSQTVLFRLDQGDVVSVQNEAANDAVHGGLYTTFSGFLLPEEAPVTGIIG